MVSDVDLESIEPGGAVGTVVGSSTLELADDARSWTMSYPSNWVVADLDDPSWLDGVGDAVVNATWQWANELAAMIGERVILPDPDENLVEIVTAVQADIVSGFRALTDDAPPSALAYGIDVIGVEAEVMTTVCAVTVVAGDAGRAGPVAEAHVNDLTDSEGETFTLGVGEWSIPAPDRSTTLVLRARTVGPAAGDIMHVFDAVAATAAPGDGGASVDAVADRSDR
jgi:hypothetical protein